MVLPCAGSGSRLGLPFPKELAPLGPGRLVVDSSLDLIRAAAGGGADVRVLVLTDGTRQATCDYVRARLPGVPVAEVRQDPAAGDMAEGVLGVRAWFGLLNVLLLPDVAYQWAGDPVGEVADAAKSSGFAVAAVKAAPEQVRHLGALYVNADRVRQFEDKPADPDGYNAFWGMLGFTSGSFGVDGLCLVAASAAKRRPPVTEPPVAGAPVTWLAGYRDCGTWDGYDTARREHRGV